MKDFTLYSDFKAEAHLEDVGNLTIPEYLLPRVEKAVENGKSDWIINSITGEIRKFKNFERLTRRIGSAFYKRGLRKGDTVLYLTHDMFYVHTLFVGIWRANGIMRASYPEDDQETLLDRVEESRVGWILCEPEMSTMCLSVASQVYWDVEVIVIGEAEGCVPLDVFFDDDGSELPESKIDGSDIALILCTSGTTGKSKGAVHTHRSLLHGIIGVSLILPTESPNLIASKATHVTGSVFPLACLASGATAVVIGQITKTNLFQAVQSYRPGLVFGFPTFLLLLVHDEEASQYDFSSLVVAMTGGAPVTPAMESALLTLPNLKLLINAYGLTEVLPVTTECDFASPSPTLTKYPGTPPFSIGKVFVGVKLQIRDIETQEVLGPLQRGEIWIKSKSLFHSYFKNLQATSDAFTDGWFKTGDVGYYDDQGFIFLVDRIKEIFKYYNNHISPTELEDVISKHEDVAEVCVVGVVDPDGGDRIPRAFVKLKSGSGCSTEEIRQFANDKLPDYKHLRGGLYILSEFPLGKTGKVSRQLMEKIIVN